MYDTDINQIAIFNIGGKTIDELGTRVFTYDLAEHADEWLLDLNKYWNESHATLPGI